MQNIAYECYVRTFTWSGRRSISDIQPIFMLANGHLLFLGKLNVPSKTSEKNLLSVTTYFGYDILEIC
jgi:hypothetical protein